MNLPPFQMGPTATALTNYFAPSGEMFGSQDPLQQAFGGQASQGPEASVQQAFGNPGPQQPLPGLGVPFTDQQMQGLYGQAPQQQGGIGQAFQGVPLPNAPHLQAPQMDISKLFDPIIESLKDPQKVPGATTLDKVSQVLGQAAQGAQFGLLRPETGAAGVISGAGAGASRAMEELRREEQALTIEHQRAVERMQQARAGVQSQKAGAEMNLARDIANTRNMEMQMQFTRDVQASTMSQQRVQPLGDGRVMITQFDPNTGQGSQQIIDTVPETIRFWQMAYLQSRAAANYNKDSRKEPKFFIDGKAVPQSAIFGSANEAFSTPAQKESQYLALQIAQDPVLFNQYAKDLEEMMAGMNPEDPSFSMMFKRLNEAPGEMTIDYIASILLQNPGERAQAWERIGGKGGFTGAGSTAP